MNVGFIGTGNMGRILIEAFLEAKVVTPSSMYITNRTIEKARAIQEENPNIHVCANIDELVNFSDYIFVCVKPLDIHPLLIKLRKQLSSEKCLISITSPLSVEQIESVVPCQVARVIPSITNRALSGVSLITLGKSCTPETKTTIEEMFRKISTPIYIKNNVTRVASDIVSCGPAFFSYLLQQFIDAAVEETEIANEQAIQLASEMFIGMGKLLESGHYTLPTLQEKVCVKGGVTGEGIKVLEKEIGNLFKHLFQSTHSKYYKDLEEVSEQFQLL
ncbi:late competence protein ComER [Bacillus sp. FJAT-47783]|uniref:late competence protein ComER n=1 Tax=Bacillus sp. FJAT-47783 TaxID=2922712 RepID=UPI001FAB9476|nr:late competence protein ComER [Bacillus sp. FJAT-47783]